MQKSLAVSFSILVLIMVAGCAPRAYKDALTAAVRMENQLDYERAYEYYRQALKAKPNDAQIKKKINELGKIIGAAFTEDAIQAFENRKHKTALGLLEKALAYDAGSIQANKLQSEIKVEYKKIMDEYSQVESLTLENRWIEAVDALRGISEIYHDDPQLEGQINEVQNKGYLYFMKAGSDARKEGAYYQSLGHFESADFVKTTNDSQKELNAARKYVNADKLYMSALEMAERGNIIEAMEALIQSKEIVDDHVKVNQLIAKLIPEWSPLIFERGKEFMDSNQTEKAYEAFFSLNRFNPEFPEASRYFEELRSKFLKESYRYLVEAQNAKNYALMAGLSQKILKENSGFLDTREIMARTAVSAFNVFYQKGLYYMKTGNFGKAILCFRSADQQLSGTRLTRDLIRGAWDQIKKGSSLNMVFLDFSQEIGDPSVSSYITRKIKERLKNDIKGNGFKNLFVQLEGNEENGFITISGMTSDIDWGAVLSKGYNAVIAGNIRLLMQDTLVGSEWKTRKRTVRKFVDNEEHTRLLIRQAELRSGMNSKPWRKEKRISKGQIEDQLEEIAERLLTIPPKIEMDVEEEKSYQLVKHTMTAHTQLDVEILAPDGSHIWPMKRYEDVYKIEDSVIPPNLASDDPKERTGDPLTLPSESEFKEQAIDHIVENKIIPDLVENFWTYGIRFYNKANKLSAIQDKSDPTAFLDSFEEYYKFLACYEDRGEEDRLREEVEKKLDSYLSDLWLIRKRQ